jgi:prepilin-type N-terminal cleavage/methylation domain-containing protein
MCGWAGGYFTSAQRCVWACLPIGRPDHPGREIFLMTKKTRNAGFTLIELLVVVAIIALLLSILLPSLAGAREQGKKAKCLANLKNLGSAMYQYANDDKAEQLIPIHMNMVQTCSFWEWKTVIWFAWGGNSGSKVFRATEDGAWVLDDDDSDVAGQKFPEYAAYRRPLNLYMLDDVGGSGDTKSQKLEWFECPSDVGYPDDPRIDDAPRSNAERSCYETLGNSYRASLSMYTAGEEGAGPSKGHFSSGPWGHRVSTLLDTSKTILAGEPTFFNMIGRDTEEGITDDVPVFGWHKKKQMDNLLFCDASARMTKAEKQTEVDAADVLKLNLAKADAIHRGTDYRLDTYPVPGALIWGRREFGEALKQPTWPWRGYQDNLHVPD